MGSVMGSVVRRGWGGEFGYRYQMTLVAFVPDPGNGGVGMWEIKNTHGKGKLGVGMVSPAVNQGSSYWPLLLLPQVWK